ncbi:unnamed protein product [Amoebophrya sp. A25]|nr:unnamed protein product [Amoebophrya sp. A25]|eukprot:GSA25T00001755001.1
MRSTLVSPKYLMTPFRESFLEYVGCFSNRQKGTTTRFARTSTLACSLFRRVFSQTALANFCRHLTPRRRSSQQREWIKEGKQERQKAGKRVLQKATVLSAS